MFSPDQYAALREGAGIVDRSSRGRLMLDGADRLAYLQGLLTNDTAALTPGTGCYAAYLTAQGRMIADVRLFELGDALLADVEPHVLATVRDRWNMFIFSEDVRIADITPSTAQIGIYGPGAAPALAAALAGAAPAGVEPGPGTAAALEAMPPYASTRRRFHGHDAIVLRRDDGGVRGFDVVLPIDLKGELFGLLRDHGGVAVDAGAMEAVRIEAGVPAFGQDMNEETIPLEAGIEDRAISLTKGCYVGQEIIIRVLHRGQGRVARRLVGFTFEPGASPAAGWKVSAGEREIGTLTSATDSPALGRRIALGYVHRDFVQPGTAVTVRQGETVTAATVTPLPFV
jgi:folate-binding protein YgfZ